MVPSRGFTWNIKSKLLWKTMKKYLWMSSAAVMISALRDKMNGYTFRGNNSCHFHCCLPYKLGSSQSKFFPLRVDLILGRLQPPGKPNRKQRKLCPFENMAEKMEVYVYSLIVHVHQITLGIFRWMDGWWYFTFNSISVSQKAVYNGTWFSCRKNFTISWIRLTGQHLTKWAAKCIWMALQQGRVQNMICFSSRASIRIALY